MNTLHQPSTFVRVGDVIPDVLATIRQRMAVTRAMADLEALSTVLDEDCVSEADAS